MKLPRTVRGRRPEFFATEGVDEAMLMILVLAQEFAVMRERMDTAEQVMAKHGIDLAAEIEAFEPDDAVLREREEALQAFQARLFSYQRQRRAEMEGQYGEAEYQATLDKVATGEI